MKTALLVVQVIVSLLLIGTILLQSGRSAGISGAIAGGAQSLFGKKKGLDDFLGKVTAYLLAVFFGLTLLVTLL